MDPTALNAAIRLFPLLGRPRPSCPSLTTRVHEIADIAHTARAAWRQGTDALDEAAHALNKAALLASDCGLADDARRLCWQHIDLYRAAGPRLTVGQARCMLEPATNLARLHLRSNGPQAALLILNAMHNAVTTGTDLLIDGRVLPLADLTGTPGEHSRLREWVWLQLLSDGIRALVLAGRWADAVALAETHRGIGAHLMEGRQVAILAALVTHTPGAARSLLHASTLTELWEHQVASCLEVMCSGTDQAASCRAAAVMIHQFQDSRPVVGYAVFRARLGLAVTALSRSCTTAAAALLTQVTDEAIAARDGYAARDILNHRIPDADLPSEQRQALNDLLAASGLNAGPLPPPLQEAFTNATTTAATTLAASLENLQKAARRLG